MLDGMGSYMLTPVQAGMWERLWNPTWVPLAVHRMVANFMIAGYSLAAYGAWRAWRPSDRPSQSYYRYLFKTGYAIGLGALLLQPFTGLWYRALIDRAAPGTSELLMEGAYRPIVQAQFLLIGLLFLGNYLLLKSTRPSHPGMRWFDIGFPVGAVLLTLSVGQPEFRPVWLYGLVGLTVWYLMTWWRTSFTLADRSGTYIRSLAAGMGLLSILLYLTMGTIREMSRRPDRVGGQISVQDEVRPQVPFEGAIH
jgi:cytochrome bd-type quinol oxidase subunit 1